MVVENVQQEPVTAYTVNGTTLTFTEAPPTGTNNIYVIYQQSNNNAQVTLADGSVTYAKLANNIRLFTSDNLTPNGNNSVFTLSEPPADANTVFVTVDGVVQRAPVHYTTSGTTITFTSAPPAGSNVHVRHLGFRTSTTVTAIPVGTYIPQPNIATPTITSPTITGTTTTNGDLWLANGSLGIGTTSLTTQNGGVSLSAGMKSSLNMNFGFETNTLQNGGNLEFRRTSRATSARYAQIGGQEDSSGNGLILFYAAAAGADVGESFRSNPYGIGLGGAIPSTGIGITFPGTQNQSSNANTLDDYEEGTFTPTIVATTTNPTVSYGRQDGRYVKIGMLVYATGSIVVNSISGGSGNLAVAGFPFASRNSSEADRAAINFSYVSGFSATTIPTSGIFNGGQTYAEMLVFNSADARGGRTSYIGSPPAAGFNIYYTTCYCTNT